MKKENIKSLLLIFMVAVIIMLPMFLNPYHSGHDTCFHVSNVSSLVENIKNNFLNPSIIVSNMAHNFGYGTKLFYPPLAHTVVAYLAFFIGNVLLSFKIWHLLSLFLSGVTMYFLSKKLSKSNKIGILSAIIYMIFPYHLSDIYIRDAIAESFLFIFIPMIISSLYELYYGDKNKFYFLFIFGYVGGMFSHLTMMVYLTFFVVCFLIYKFKDTIKYLKYFIISSLFILLIASPFLITVIEQKFMGNYSVFVPYHMAQNIMGLGLLPYNYIDIFNGYGNDDIKYFIDIVSIILLLVTFINYKKIKKNKFYNIVLVFGIVSLLFSFKFFPWDLLPNSMRMVQFPWRFETFVSISVALLAPLCLTLLKKKNVNKVMVLCITGMVLFIYPNLTFANDNLIDVNDFWRDGGMGWQKEYLPVNTADNMDYYDSRTSDIIVIAGTSKVKVLEDQTPKLTFEISDKSTLEFPRLYYIGYTLKNSNGVKINISEDKYGFISADINESGTYTLDYTGTKIDNICNKISILSIIIFIGWRIYEKVKHNRSLL